MNQFLNFFMYFLFSKEESTVLLCEDVNDHPPEYAEIKQPSWPEKRHLNDTHAAHLTA